MLSIIHLPRSLQHRIDAAAFAFLYPHKRSAVDFMCPLNEEALLPPHSLSWRIFKSPIALFVGGMAAVILELAQPSVRAGVWSHSSFRRDPVGRLRRTGLAAMVTVYGARSIAEPMIARVRRLHHAVRGETDGGLRYAASDPHLLTWVHATAVYGIAHAYSRFVDRLSDAELDALYLESAPASLLYGAFGAPTSEAQADLLFESMHGSLEPSPIVFEFLRIMRESATLPHPLRWLQPVLVRAAVEIVPKRIRRRLALTDRYGLTAREQWLVRIAGNLSNRVVLPESPAVQSCRRLGLPTSHLYA